MNKKNKILVFIDWFLPGYKAGGPVRSCANMIQALSKEFDFYVFTRNVDYTETTPYTNIPANTWTQQDNYKAYYVSQDKLSYKVIRQIINELNYDVIYINGIYSKWFSVIPLKLLKKKFPQTKIIVAPRGMLAPTAIKVKFIKKKIFLTLANAFNLYKDTVFHATNIDETEQIKTSIRNYKIIIVADNIPQTLKPCTQKIFDNNVLKLCCIARIAPEKNQLYALQVLQNCNNRIDFSIYGPIYDFNYWNNCLQLIKMLPENIHVKYHGTIQFNEIAKILCENDFLFLPTRGENYGHIIAESLSSGIPVIISSNTPWKNLQENNAGYNYDLNNKQQFIETIQKLSSISSEEYNVMRVNACKYFEKTIDLKKLIQQYIKLFNP